MIIKKIAPLLTAAALLFPSLTGGIIATTMAIAPTIIAPEPAAAAWWDNVTGVYMNIYGSQYYYGSYVQDPNPKFEGSTWELNCGGNVCAHGYSRSIPRVVQWVAQRLGR
jgi:hypothetical protein